MCKWFVYGPAYATATPSSVASLKSRLVQPFWCQLTQVVLEKRPLNGCLSVCLSVCLSLFLWRLFTLLRLSAHAYIACWIFSPGRSAEFFFSVMHLIITILWNCRVLLSLSFSSVSSIVVVIWPNDLLPVCSVCNFFVLHFCLFLLCCHHSAEVLAMQSRYKGCEVPSKKDEVTGVIPLPSNRHHRSNSDCLQGKREKLSGLFCAVL